MPALAVFVSLLFMSSAAFGVEVIMNCGKMKGHSGRLLTDVRPGQLEPDEILNGFYRFELSSNNRRFVVQFVYIEGKQSLSIEELKFYGNGQVISILSKRAGIEQKFYLQIDGNVGRMIYVSEMLLRSGEIQISTYAADCQTQN